MTLAMLGVSAISLLICHGQLRRTTDAVDAVHDQLKRIADGVPRGDVPTVSV